MIQTARGIFNDQRSLRAMSTQPPLGVFSFERTKVNVPAAEDDPLHGRLGQVQLLADVAEAVSGSMELPHSLA
jgi:hypothetical protein